MKVEEAHRLTRLLAGAAATDERPRFHVDTFHYTYAQFARTFLLPGVNLYGIEAGEAEEIIRSLLAVAPHFVRDCHVLPEPRPLKESNHLHFVRPYERDGQKYIYLFKVLAEYRGGASDTEVIRKAGHGHSAQIMTNRLYYQARLFPVNRIIYQGPAIVDFEVVRLMDSLKNLAQAAEAHNIETIMRDRYASVFFEEVDFSRANAELTRLFGYGQEWKLPRIFWPLLVDYATLSLNLIDADAELVELVVPHFHESCNRFLKTGDTEAVQAGTRNFWTAYYQAWDFEPTASRAGNPHWKLTRHVDTSWYRALAGHTESP